MIEAIKVHQANMVSLTSYSYAVTQLKSQGSQCFETGFTRFQAMKAF
jgi:hypothetical protein